MSKDYYDGDKCLDVIRFMTMGAEGEQAFALGNLVKYLYRAGRKSNATYEEDLVKARDYANLLMKGRFYE